jgi:steroid 5-alpha reductase family enzyme
MIIETLVVALIFVVLYMCSWYGLSLIYAKNDLADLAWGLGFAGLAWMTAAYNSAWGWSNLILVGFVTVWGVRLFAHIFARNVGKPEDFRYAQMRQQWGGYAAINSFIRVFMLQGLLMLLVSAPVWFLNTGYKSDFHWWFLAGVVVWVIGFFFETVGDWQLKKFISDPNNKGKIMTQGLWRYTRHPNYFGEVILWWGVYLMALAYAGWWTIIGPLTITYLILKVSGIPMLEKKYENNKEFQAYKARTNAFFPWAPSK